MKKLSFVAVFMLLCSAAFAQWSVSGTVTDVNSQPVAGKTVYVSTDSIPNINPIYWGQDVTDANGNYNVSFATGTPNAMQEVKIQIMDCNNTMITDTVLYSVPQITHNFTLCVAPPAATDIHGVISANSVAQDDAEVYLIALDIDSMTNDTTLTAIDSTTTDAQGYYSLNLPNVFYYNHLLVKAALLPANANYSGYLPTYYTSSLMWDGAAYLPNPLPLTNVDIDLIAGVNPGGPAFIGGNVAQGANKSTAVGDPLPNRILILTNSSNVPVAYTYSNAAGQFSFSGLAYGTYHLFGDVWGKSNPELTVMVDAAHPSISNIEFQEHSHEFEGHIATAVGNVPAALKSAIVFPTPATDKIHVVGISNVTGTRNITLTAMNGAVVYSHNFSEKEAIAVPVGSLSKGIYMLHINTNEGNAIFKVVK